jgi:hypothetical protein
LTHYDLLGVDSGAPEEELRRVIAQLTTQWSKRSTAAVNLEKRQEAERMLAALAEARRVLLNSMRRAAYDAHLAQFAIENSDLSVPTCPLCAESLPGPGQPCRWCGDDAALPRAPHNGALAGPASGARQVAASPTAAPSPKMALLGGGLALALVAIPAVWVLWPKPQPFHYDFRQDLLDKSHVDLARPSAADAWVLPAMFPELVDDSGAATALQRRRAADGYGMPEVWSHLRGTYVQRGHQEDIFLAAIEDPTTAHPENWHKYYVAVFEGHLKVVGPVEIEPIDGLVANVRFSQSPVDHVLTRSHFMAQGFLSLGATLARIEDGKLRPVVNFGEVGSDDTGAYGDGRATVMAAAVAYVPETWPPQFRVDEYEAQGGVDAERLKFKLRRSRTQLDIEHSPPAAE